MKFNIYIVLLLLILNPVSAQENIPTDFLSPEFHSERRDAFRARMPENSVAVFFSNPVRNRSNDVDYVYHQDPDFYYLTGLREPHAALVIYSDSQTDANGEPFDEAIYVQKRSPMMEQWTGKRLGPEGARENLGFIKAFNGSAFVNSNLDLSKFSEVWLKPIVDDIRDQRYNRADLFSLVNSFKSQTMSPSSVASSKNTSLGIELKAEGTIKKSPVKTNAKEISRVMAELRQIKTEEELRLLKKAIRISAQGQIEVMKAMKPDMSETEIQGIHEYVYKKYGSEFEGYPSIVGAGNNGCVLHYIENNKMTVQDELVLMDLGAEYHGYTADVTRTIPADGTFSREQKQIYDLVYQAQ
ncbi:MAG: aminopeptidase P N-terminal domain-containing protein, partial [Bacteroidia bacterium]|nr:aminopeptidase P N-terminal domain-containing protein [Bacteroidia bacterium]